MWTVDKGSMASNITNTLADQYNMAPTKPHPDNHAGTSFA
jgi:hypothetical protein